MIKKREFPKNRIQKRENTKKREYKKVVFKHVTAVNGCNANNKISLPIGRLILFAKDRIENHYRNPKHSRKLKEGWRNKKVRGDL